MIIWDPSLPNHGNRDGHRDGNWSAFAAGVGPYIKALPADRATGKARGGGATAAGVRKSVSGRKQRSFLERYAGSEGRRQHTRTDAAGSAGFGGAAGADQRECQDQALGDGDRIPSGRRKNRASF